MRTPKELLERYVEAKDGNRPALILEFYDPQAVLTYSIATDTISFPAIVHGAEAIADTLVGSFGKRFMQCRTYYVCDAIDAESRRLDRLPWLVVMQEVLTNALRIGKGYYRWDFQAAQYGLRVKAMHIHIERMDAIEDRSARLLHRIHAELDYPWLPPSVLNDGLDRLLSRNTEMDFLRAFKVPQREAPPQ
ncbi:MAG: hypothetical protein C5B46_06110 [Proteobacteria bacterium]|nr:MAG: hypothetical protein C5B46_06110 [Pseudomonadota bacterium]